MQTRLGKIPAPVTMDRLLLTFFLTSFTLGVPLKDRIYGGDIATPGQFPFIASINIPDQYCDASIIDKSWVLTAAHCIDRIDNQSIILVGTNLQHSGGQEYKASKWIQHEGFDYYTLQNDIGLVKIEGEFTFDDLVQSVEFKDPEANATCHAAGWGTTESVEYPEELQFVEQKAYDLETCKEIIGEPVVGTYLGPEQVCAFDSEGTGVCYGDSGGPLVCDGKLAGVASFLLGGCALGYPDVYTRPAAYADWITRNLEA